MSIYHACRAAATSLSFAICRWKSPLLLRLNAKLFLNKMNDSVFDNNALKISDRHDGGISTGSKHTVNRNERKKFLEAKRAPSVSRRFPIVDDNFSVRTFENLDLNCSKILLILSVDKTLVISNILKISFTFLRRLNDIFLFRQRDLLHLYIISLNLLQQGRN